MVRPIHRIRTERMICILDQTARPIAVNRRLLACILFLAVAATSLAQPIGVFREVYSGISGSAVSDHDSSRSRPA